MTAGSVETSLRCKPMGLPVCPSSYQAAYSAVRPIAYGREVFCGSGPKQERTGSDRNLRNCAKTTARLRALDRPRSAVTLWCVVAPSLDDFAAGPVTCRHGHPRAAWRMPRPWPYGSSPLIVEEIGQ